MLNREAIYGGPLLGDTKTLPALPPMTLADKHTKPTKEERVMQQSVHRFIAQYFMDHSHLMLERNFVSRETGSFKCFFTIEKNEDPVTMILEYLPVDNEDDSWLSVRGVIGHMGEIQNLCRIAKYFRRQTEALYTLLMEERGSTLILSRSFRVRNLDQKSMFELTDGLANTISLLRQMIMLPHGCYLEHMRCQEEYLAGKYDIPDSLKKGIYSDFRVSRTRGSS